jgi:glycosyltransferase involved in cell wall biosynthesis
MMPGASIFVGKPTRIVASNGADVHGLKQLIRGRKAKPRVFEVWGLSMLSLPSITPMRALYLSHTGMTEPLGQAQVLPYLVGLAQSGIAVEVHSFEPSSSKPSELAEVRAQLADHAMEWHPTVRSSSHALYVKFGEAGKAAAFGLVSALRRRPQIVHARSYLPAAVADVIATLAPDARLLFDCRGMLGDEYVDAGHWTRDRAEYKLLKLAESRLFRRSDGVVVLTRALAAWLQSQGAVGKQTQLSVIPCCTPIAKFEVDEAVRAEVRSELGVLPNEALLVYSGSLGTWYQQDEMAEFFGLVHQRMPGAKFLLLSKSPSATFEQALRTAVPEAKVIARAVTPSAMPRYLAAGDVGLSFIMPCFSKKGSSPTKVAEYLAAGMPVVLNGDIGDQQDLAAESEACIVVANFGKQELVRAADALTALLSKPRPERIAACRSAARKHFDMESVGVARYQKLYEELCAKPRATLRTRLGLSG